LVQLTHHLMFLVMPKNGPGRHQDPKKFTKVVLQMLLMKPESCPRNHQDPNCSQQCAKAILDHLAHHLMLLVKPWP